MKAQTVIDEIDRLAGNALRRLDQLRLEAQVDGYLQALDDVRQAVSYLAIPTLERTAVKRPGARKPEDQDQ